MSHELSPARPIPRRLAGPVMMGWALAAVSARAQSAQLDPAGSNVILTAVDWLQGTLLGNVATALERFPT